MSRINLDYDAAHTFVDTSAKSGNDVRWDGWDMVFFTPTHYGFSNPKGAYRNGRWGMEYRVSADDNGIWKVNHKSVKSPR
jgi:hypothetical protein